MWRSSLNDNIGTTKVTFGVVASSFAANMAVKRNSIELSQYYPQTAQVVKNSFYVDDCLTGQMMLDLQ